MFQKYVFVKMATLCFRVNVRITVVTGRYFKVNAMMETLMMAMDARLSAKFKYIIAVGQTILPYPLYADMLDL